MAKNTGHENAEKHLHSETVNMFLHLNTWIWNC